MQDRGRKGKWEEGEVKQQSSVTKASVDATVNSGARVLAEVGASECPELG